MARLSKLRHAAQFEAVLSRGYRRSSANFGAQALLQEPPAATAQQATAGELDQPRHSKQPKQPRQIKQIQLQAGMGEPRLGLIASRKAAPRSVDRNRGKRLARAVFTECSSLLPPLDLVLRLKNNLRRSSNASLRAELQQLVHDMSKRAGGRAAPAASHDKRDAVPGVAIQQSKDK